MADFFENVGGEIDSSSSNVGDPKQKGMTVLLNRKIDNWLSSYWPGVKTRRVVIGENVNHAIVVHEKLVVLRTSTKTTKVYRTENSVYERGVGLISLVENNGRVRSEKHMFELLAEELAKLTAAESVAEPEKAPAEVEDSDVDESFFGKVLQSTFIKKAVCELQSCQDSAGNSLGCGVEVWMPVYAGDDAANPTKVADLHVCNIFDSQGFESLHEDIAIRNNGVTAIWITSEKELTVSQQIDKFLKNYLETVCPTAQWLNSFVIEQDLIHKDRSKISLLAICKGMLKMATVTVHQSCDHSDPTVCNLFSKDVVKTVYFGEIYTQ